MPNPARFEKTYDVIRTDDELGVVYGWGAIFTEDGNEYFDTQGDAIDPDAMEAAALDFAESGRIAGDLHEDECGTIPFILPITDATRAAFEMNTNLTGLAIGMKPNDEVFGKFKSGEYTGFSIGGTREEEFVVEKVAKRLQKQDGKKKFRQGRRRRMTKFTLEEISAVDSPAQVGAKAVLMKRRGEPGYDPKNPDKSKRGRAEEGETIEKRAILTTAADGHSHLMVIDPEDGTGAKPAGFTSFEDGHQHPWILLDDGTYEIGMSNGHMHGVGALSTGQETAMNLLNQQRGVRKMAEPTELEKMQKRVDRAEKVAELTDAQKGFFGKLAEKDADAFLAKSAEDRQTEVDASIAKANEADPVVAKLEDGTEIRKSSDPLLIKLAKDAENSRKEIAKLRSTNSDATMRKRAEEELSHLPGTVDERANVLKAIESLPEDQREPALKAISAGNTAMKSAFRSVGNGGSDAGGNGAESQGFAKAEDELDTLTKARVADKGGNYFDHYDDIVNENPGIAKRALGGQAAAGLED